MTDDHATRLTEEGRAEVEALARRHGVAPEAVHVLLLALERGGGQQAQFSHPDLGGMGQWSRGGMIMVGDMFNNGLKARVDALCRDTAALLEKPGLMRSGRHAAGDGGWWPADCGSPSATGAQNDMRYACFPETRRLAIGRGDRVEVYDTGEHRIHGVSQQQGHGQDLRFTSQLGTIALHDLRRIEAEGEPMPEVNPEPPRRDVPDETPAAGSASPTERPTSVAPSAPSGGGDIIDTLERLHALHRKGVLSEAEFSEKKKELLGRL